MYSKIKQARLRGVARSERDLANDAGVDGSLTLFRVDGHLVLQLKVDHRETLAPLHEPVCVGIRGEFQVWRGFQRPGGGADSESPAYLQEWRVQVLRPA